MLYNEIMLVYFYVSGILSFLLEIYDLKIKKDKEKLELIESYRDNLPIDLEYLLYIFSMLLGFIVFPVSILNRIYKLITGKDFISKDF